MQLQELVAQGDLGVILFAELGAREGTTALVGKILWDVYFGVSTQ